MARSKRRSNFPSQANCITSRLRAIFGIILVSASETVLRLGAVHALAQAVPASKDHKVLLTRLAATQLGFSKNEDEIQNCIEADQALPRSGEQEQRLKEIAATWLETFQAALQDDQVSTDRKTLSQRISNMFHPDECFWRDMVAFTWNIVTMEGVWQIVDYFAASSSSRRQSTTYDWKLDPSKEMIVTEHSNNNDGTRFNKHVVDNTSNGSENGKRRLEFWATFSTSGGPGRAHIRLVLDSHKGNKAYTLLTVLSGLHQRPWQCAPYQRPVLSPHGPIAGRRYWHETKWAATSTPAYDQPVDTPFVLIIGGGQAGLSLGARLQLLHVPYLICESGTQPGSAWGRRYPSLCLHDPVYYNHLPYLPFPRTWPTFCPRDKLASWMKHYADALDLNVRCRTKVVGATWNVLDREWIVQMQTRSENDPRAKSSTATIRAKHIVFATGNSSHPRIPSITGRSVFRGIQLHSSQYEGGRAYSNKNLKHVVVIGSNNSAFDIAQDLWEQLMGQGNDSDGVSHLKSITMIQRTASMIVSPDSVLRLGLGPLYAEDAALPHEEADLVATTVPYRLALKKWKLATNRMTENDRMMLDGVAQAGYRLDSGPDGTGIFAKSATEGGGFYINVGCADLLMRGDIEVRYATVERLEEDAVLVRHKDTGREERLPADMIVYATGFHTMESWVSEICGKEIAEQVGPTWGLGLGTEKDPGPWQGELRNMWKPTAVEGLWFQGGNLAQNRHYSRYLALQLAARHAGVGTPVYGVAQPRDI